MKTKNVALVLSSGGPRGFAYIGGIEALLERGYQITSIAGTSMGSLIAGIYAAGKLAEFKEWLYSLDTWELFSLMDLSIAKNHFVKGEKIMFFGFSDRADKNGDGRVDMWEAAEELYAYDSIMGTNTKKCSGNRATDGTEEIQPLDDQSSPDDGIYGKAPVR